MSRTGQDLIEAMQELLDYSEGKIDLRTSRLNVSPVCETISVDDDEYLLAMALEREKDNVEIE